MLSVVVPCFDEEEVLAELHRRLTAACVATGVSYEVILVNDGSRDRTWQRIAALAQRDPAVVGVDLSRNHGHQLALTAGLSLCRGERIFILDADLQDPPELLPDMMRRIDEGADVVYGKRIARDGESSFKRLTAAGFYRLMHGITNVDIPQDVGDYRLMRHRVLDVLRAMPEQHRFVRGMVAWIGFKQVALPYARAARHAGKTKYPLRNMLRFAIDAMTGFSIAPLRLSFYVSLLFLTVAALMAGYVLYSYLFLSAVPGWTSMFLVLLMFGAIQLLCLGIMGEYVGRIYMEAKRRPLFVIREVLADRGADKADSGGD